MRKHVAGLNVHRRAHTTPLTNEEKRMRVEAELKTDPARSDRAIAEVVGVHPTTVGTVRKGGVSNLDTPSERKSRTGKVGEGQKKVMEAARCLNRHRHIKIRASFSTTYATPRDGWNRAAPKADQAVCFLNESGVRLLGAR